MKLVSGLVLLTFAIASRAVAGVGVWTTNGPTGGAVSVVVDPYGVVYAGVVGPGAYAQPITYKSRDAGMTWSALSVQAVPLAAGPGGIVYAGFPNAATATLYVSRDGGNGWMPVVMKEDTAFSVTIDPFQASTAFRVDLSTPGFGPTFTTLWRTADAGASWSEVDDGLGIRNAGGPYISAFAADPKTPNVFYAAIGDSNFLQPQPVASKLYLTTNSGSTWSLLNDGIGGTVQSLGIDPFYPATLYAGIGPDPQTGYGTSGLLRSVDGGVTFRQISSVALPSVTMDPVRSNHLYVVSSSVGVLASPDGGSTWTPMNNGLPDQATIYSLAIAPNGKFLHAATPIGVFDFELASSTCVSDSHTLCLNNGRFSVTASFQTTPEGPSAPATAVPLTADTGYFWFFDPSNIELVTKVLTGCVVNGHYWFFASGLTNVGVQIGVTNTVSGATKPYSNPFGTPFQPIQDTAAFPCP